MKTPSFITDESHKMLTEPFLNWCVNNNVNTDNEEDMKPWWECFLAGATCMYLKIRSGDIDA